MNDYTVTGVMISGNLHVAAVLAGRVMTEDGQQPEHYRDLGLVERVTYHIGADSPQAAEEAAAGEVRWTDHETDAGTWCDWSDTKAHPGLLPHSDVRCPAGCRASRLIDKSGW